MKDEIVVPQNVTVELKDTVLKISGPEGSIEKEFKTKVITIKKEGNKIVLEAKNERRKTFAVFNTIKSIINNMISGVNKKYKYVLKGVYSHFPMTLGVKGNAFVINNFLGEKAVRSVKIPDNVNVSVKGKDVFVTSVDKEKAGIVAGLIENCAKVSKKDRRTFQDGVYIVAKGVQDE